jgi:hypothetical protein
VKGLDNFLLIEAWGHRAIGLTESALPMGLFCRWTDSRSGQKNRDAGFACRYASAA